MDRLVEICNDLFDIAARLKSINDGYRVFFNKDKQRFEVHDVNCKPLSLAFVVPYDELDSRTVDYALFTRVENAENVFKQVEESNRLAEKAETKRRAERILEKVV